MLRICLDARLDNGTAGGVQSVVIGLAHGLSQFSDGDERYFFLAHPGAHDWLKPYCSGPCEILEARTPAPARKLKSRLPKIARQAWHQIGPLLGKRMGHVPESDGTVEAAKIDIMHFTTQWGFRTPLPSLYHPHDLQHLHFPEYFTPWVRFVREIHYRAMCNQARLVPVASTWTRNDVVKQYGLPAEKVKVIPLAPVLTAYPDPSEAELKDVRARYSLPDAFMLYPANTWPHKNHLALLEALAHVRDTQGVRLSLICSGDRNEYFSVIERRIHDLQLTEQARFVGFVSPMDLQCLYRLSRFVIIPTLFEAASGPLWDAFLAGAPAACSNVTSLPAQAGDSALIFDPNDHKQIAETMWKLWTDDPLRHDLAERGRKNVARFSWERSAKTFRANYRQMSGRPMTDEDRSLLKAIPLI
jgi:glycosyltransferase involved in cell wall biosynthesis